LSQKFKGQQEVKSASPSTLLAAWNARAVSNVATKMMPKNPGSLCVLTALEVVRHLDRWSIFPDPFCHGLVQSSNHLFSYVTYLHGLRLKLLCLPKHSSQRALQGLIFVIFPSTCQWIGPWNGRALQRWNGP
jgi:hypothetical protein